MTATERTYHHGDLPQTLRLAAADLISERGPSGFSLREVARRAGVSHAAPAHHFGDVTGLLTAVATDAFTHLHQATAAAAAAHEDAIDRLCAVGRAYVELAISNPGHCAVAFRHDIIDADAAEYLIASNQAYGVLIDALVALADQINPDLDVELAAATCWASMQGIVELYSSMRRRDEEQGQVGPATNGSIGDLAEQVARQIVAGFGKGA